MTKTPSAAVSPKKRQPKYLWNDKIDGKQFVRAWSDNRSEYAIQIWNSGEPVGEPDGDWAMPKVLPLEVAIRQAIIQTPEGE